MSKIVLIPHSMTTGAFGVLQDGHALHITCYMCGSIFTDQADDTTKCLSCNITFLLPEDTYNGGVWASVYLPVGGSKSERVAQWLHNWLRYEVEVTIE